MKGQSTNQATRRFGRLRGSVGATLVEYSLIIALVVVPSIGAMNYLTKQANKETNNQADCISTRPPPPSCQVRPVTTTTTAGDPATSTTSTPSSTVPPSSTTSSTTSSTVSPSSTTSTVPPSTAPPTTVPPSTTPPTTTPQNTSVTKYDGDWKKNGRSGRRTYSWSTEDDRAYMRFGGPGGSNLQGATVTYTYTVTVAGETPVTLNKTCTTTNGGRCNFGKFTSTNTYWSAPSLTVNITILSVTKNGDSYTPNPSSLTITK